MKRLSPLLLLALSPLFAGSYAHEELIEIDSIDQITSIIQSDEKLNTYVDEAHLREARVAAQQMNELIREAIVAQGLANDGDVSIADARDINDYLYWHHGNAWRTLRGVKNKEDSSGYGWAESVWSPSEALNTNAVRLWGSVYNLGFERYDKNRLSDANGDKSGSFTSVGYALSQMMNDEAASGALVNPDITEVSGTTQTGLDHFIDVIMHDEGLLRRIATSDMRVGAMSANAMNGAILEAIRNEGLANDVTLTTADVRTINRYLVENYKSEWMQWHGDDEEGIETGYHRIQNDGAYERMYADNVINTVADGIYHLGFYTDSASRLKNEDGNNNASFEKVAWWLDSILKEDMASGALDNAQYKEVTGTTGTTFDYIIDYIYHEPGLLYRVSMDDIRTAAASANRMNELIVEALRSTGVASDGSISEADVRALNEYLSSNYLREWMMLHGDDEDDEESGYHRIQNDGALGYAYNQNVINSLADSIYHLGFPTEYANNLTNEDGKKNASFKSVAYWMNRALQEDLARGAFE